MSQKIDPKTVARMSYSDLLRLRPPTGGIQRIGWPSAAHRRHLAKRPSPIEPMEIGEAHSGMHDGVPFTIRRTR